MSIMDTALRAAAQECDALQERVRVLEAEVKEKSRIIATLTQGVYQGVENNIRAQTAEARIWVLEEALARVGVNDGYCNLCFKQDTHDEDCPLAPEKFDYE